MIFESFIFCDMVDFVLKIGKFSKMFEYKIDHNIENWTIEKWTIFENRYPN